MTFYGFLIANGAFWFMFWTSLSILFAIDSSEKDKNVSVGCGVLAVFSVIYLIAVVIGGAVS